MLRPGLVRNSEKLKLMSQSWGRPCDLVLLERREETNAKSRMGGRKTTTFAFYGKGRKKD